MSDTTKHVDLALAVSDGETESGLSHVGLSDKTGVLGVELVGSGVALAIGSVIDTTDQEDSAFGGHDGTVIGRDIELNVKFNLLLGEVVVARLDSAWDSGDDEVLGLGFEVVDGGDDVCSEVVTVVNFEMAGGTDLLSEQLEASGSVFVDNDSQGFFESSVQLSVAFIVSLLEGGRSVSELVNKVVQMSLGSVVSLVGSLRSLDLTELLINELSFSGFWGLLQSVFELSTIKLGNSWVLVSVLSQLVSEELDVVSEVVELVIKVLEGLVTGFVNQSSEGAGQLEEARIDTGLFTVDGFFEFSNDTVKLVFVDDNVGVLSLGSELTKTFVFVGSVVKELVEIGSDSGADEFEILLRGADLSWGALHKLLLYKYNFVVF